MAFLNFSEKTATEIHNAIRGYYSWPCAYFFLEGKRVKVISARVGEPCKADAGTVVACGEFLSIACKDNTTINLVEIQPEGSKRMTAKQFLCGKRIEIGTIIGENND